MRNCARCSTRACGKSAPIRSPTPCSRTCPDRERHREVANAKAAIETLFDTEVTAFAYPFGIYTDDDVATVDQAGYRFAVTTDAGISTDIEAEALRLKRIKISGKEGRLGFFTRLRTGRRGLVE